MDDFKRDIRNLSNFSEKLSELLKTEVDNVFPDILTLSEDEMIENINNGIKFILSDIYTDEVFNESSLNNLLNRKINDIRKDFKRQYEIISSSYEFYDNLNKKRQKFDDYYLTNFRKHCADCDNECFHNCARHSSRKFLIVTENGVIKDKFKYVLCYDCKKVYPSSMIQAYCNYCNTEYFTSILERNEDPDLLKATWSKYHCEQIINKEMKCLKCSQTLYLNLKTKMLECINKKCDFQSKPNRILWTCSVCKEEFKSNAIVYNPLEVETTKRVIKQTLLTKHKAHPNRISCKCKINIFFSNFYHKKDCEGILYVGELNHKIIIVCEKCKAINFYERFIWTCPSCGVRFRDKIRYKSKDEIMRIDSMHSKDMISTSQQIGRSKKIPVNNINEEEESSSKNNRFRNRFKKEENEEEEEEKPNNNRFKRKSKEEKEEVEEKRNSPINRFRHHFTKEEENVNDDNKNTNSGGFKLRRNFTTQEKNQEEDNRSHRRNQISKNDEEEEQKEIPAQNTNKSRWERLREQREREKERIKEENSDLKERREQIREKEREERELREQRTRERHERMEAREKERKEKEDSKKKDEESGGHKRIYLNKDKDSNSKNSTKRSNNSGKSDEDNVLDIQEEEEEPPQKNKHLNARQIKQQIEDIIKKGKIPEFKVEDFTLTKQLGEGSYGVIYEVTNKNRKKYAMKKIIAHDIDELDGFHQEFEFLSTCNHNNIMGIYGCCVRFLDVTTYALYVLMELAVYDWEHEIRKHLEQRQNYKEEELIDILKQIVGALKFMQAEKKIAHRDIKPQNILVFENGHKKEYKVADFGEAKEVKISKQLNTLRGTELYMSPALYDGLKKDKDDVSHDPYKSDVFSLGICFMYAAALKFNIIYETRETSDMSKIEKILHRYLKNKYTEKFIHILELMLETDEKKRMDFIQFDKYLNENFNE